MYKAFLFFFCLLGMACSSERNSEFKTIDVEYPETRKDADVVDDYHGSKVSDPYRWLEIDTAKEVEKWVAEQNKVTESYLSQIGFRDEIKERYRELFNYVKLSSPFKVGDNYFYSKNDGLQNQAVIYIQEGLDGTPEVFIDPNTMSEDGTTSVNLIGFSPDNRYVAYAISEGGSDWREVHVMDIEKRVELDDVLKWVKFSEASWDSEGFYYSRFPEPGVGMELSGSNEFHSVYYHKLGDDQSNDRLVFRDRENPKNLHFTNVTEDRKYLIMYATTGTDGFETHYMDLSGNQKKFTPLFTGFENKNTVIDNIGNKFIIHTDIDAPKYRLIKVDLKNPSKENWVELIPESKYLMEGVSTGGGKLWVSFLRNATTRISRYDYDGEGRRTIKLPGLGTASGFGGRKDDNHFFYSFSSFTRPPSIYKFDIASGTSEEFFETELEFNPDDYSESQVFYKSKDGTEIPMFIVHKKDLKLTGDHPTYLYGYGGFNVNLTPWFSSSRMILLENGGVFALPNLRGGGEFGEEWHKAGMLDKKQNVFDDFIAAAEYLIEMKYTSSDKLAIAGGSNGGLLVGACMTQRPDLFAVAFPAVGVMDMLRYHKFTIGYAWVPEYGSSEDPEQFKTLLAYSPLHNLEEGVSYPATMITTADHDDRVVPAHSFKFGARLQEAHAGDDPVILRIETDAGHGAGKSTEQIIEEQSDIWSFFFQNTNSPVKYIKG